MLNLFQWQKPSIASAKNQQRGLTIVELLVASGLTLSIISIGGLTLNNMIGIGKSTTSQNERRMELNRSLDFMANEVRQASAILADPTKVPSEFSPSATEVDTATVQPVFTLRDSNLPSSVVYYLASPAASYKTWRGPKVIYRWGPSFDANGNYGPDKNTPANWTYQPLIDNIDDSPSTVSCNRAGEVWTATPASPTGFYACIDKTGTIAQIFQKGRIQKVLGAAEPYLLQTQAFAHSSSVGTFLNPGDSKLITQTLPPGIPPSSGLKNMTFQVLGSDLRCGATNPKMNVAGSLNVRRPDGTRDTRTFTYDHTQTYLTYNFPNQPAGTTVDFTGWVPPLIGTPPNPYNGCKAERVSGTGFNSITNPVQVKVLSDGQVAPAYAAFGGGLSVKDFLKGYKDQNGNPIELIDSNGVIHLPDPQTQAIILFELGVTDTRSSAYDLQDMVILATIKPV